MMYILFIHGGIFSTAARILWLSEPEVIVERSLCINMDVQNDQPMVFVIVLGCF